MGVLHLGGVKGCLLGACITATTVNATNFMDGINGISGLTAGLWGLSTIPIGVATGDGGLAGLGAAAAGSAFGFLPYNAPEAHLFLGDVGSYLFGGMFAGGILLTIANGGPIVRVVAPLSVYLFDVAATLARRAVHGAPLTEAHREHAYQRMVSARGWTHLQASSAAIAAAAATSLLSTMTGRYPRITGIAMALPVIAYYLAAEPSQTRERSR